MRFHKDFDPIVPTTSLLQIHKDDHDKRLLSWVEQKSDVASVLLDPELKIKQQTNN